MKTKIKLLIAAAFLLMAFAGRSQCNAGFTINDNGNGNVQFQATAYVDSTIDSLNPVTFIWEFGDEATDTTFQSTVSHTYTNVGTYNICLTVIGVAHSCIVQQCDTHYVNFCAGTSQFANTVIGFGDIAYSATQALGNGFTGTWNFGDGVSGGGLAANHQYAANGSYNVCFSVAGPGCTDTTCQTINIDLCQPFNYNFTYYVVSVNPYTAEFVATDTNSSYRYQWAFSDGGYATGVDSIEHSFYTNGYNTVTLFVLSDTYGCMDSVKHVINVTRCNMSPNISESSYDTAASFNIYLSDSLGQVTSDLWNFPGGNPPNSTDANVEVNYPSLGTYTVSVYVSSHGCVDTLYDTFTLTPPPPPLYSIEGQVSAGTSGGLATVYLIVQDSTGHLALADSTTAYLIDSAGVAAYYYFNNIPADTYYVKAALSAGNPDYANFLPTYYTNSLSWASATPVVISLYNASGINIDLTPGNNPGGPGFVGGYVSQGAGLLIQGGGNNTYRSLDGPIAGVQINLLTSEDEAVAYTFTDAGGHYQFSDLAYGSYHIYAEQLNKIPVPIPFTLSSSDSSITSLNISINNDSATATGINDVNEIALAGIYPNPVINKLEVQLSSKQQVEATVKLIDILGKTILSGNTKLAMGNNKLELDMENLAAGVYQLLIRTSGQQLTYKVVKAR